MEGANRLNIYINGVKYPIRTAESQAYVNQMGREIDRLVGGMMEADKTLAVNQALVLATLNYLDAYKKAEAAADRMRDQVAQYMEDANKARQEAAEAQREIKRLERLISGKEGRG